MNLPLRGRNLRLHKEELVMNLSMLKNKKFLASFAVVAAIATTAQAAIIVHDPKIYAQIVEQIKKASEQISHLKEQITLQKENLKSLEEENIEPYRKDIAMIGQEYGKLRAEANSLISGVTDAKKAFEDNFKKFDNLDYGTMTYMDINGNIGANRQKLEDSIVQISDLLSKKQVELQESQKRIQKLTGLIQRAHGAKDLAQIENLLQAETINSQNITSDIHLLQARQAAIKTEVDKLEKDGTKAIYEKTAKDFGDAGKALIREGENAQPISSRSEAAFKVIDAQGWR